MLPPKKCRKGLFLLLLAVASGCARTPTTPSPPPSDEEPQLRTRFSEFQKALKDKDSEHLWRMLSKQSQADAERAALTLTAEYGKVDTAAKAQLDKEQGLSVAKLDQISSRDLVKTNAFQKRYEEARDGKFERAIVQGDQATVYYRDEEGDEEKLILLREDGQWKLWLKIPTIHLSKP